MTTATYATDRARATTTTTPTLPILRYKPTADGLLRWLGPTEAAIMEIIWAAERPITVKAIWREIEREYRELAYTTVMTTMERLAEKQLLDRRRPSGSSAYVYTPRETRAQFEARQAAAILASLEEE